MTTKLTTARSMRARAPREHVDIRGTAELLLREARRIGKMAEEGGDLRTAILSLDRAARALEIIAKDQETHQPEEHDDFTRNPRFLEAWQRVLDALARFPEARAAVLAALTSGTNE